MVAPPVVEMESNGQGIAETREGHTRQRQGTETKTQGQDKTKQLARQDKTRQGRVRQD